MKGFDCIEDMTPHGQQILDGGYSFVCRYYHSLSHSVKQKLTRKEALHLSGMGIYLVAVFENAGDHAGYFTYDQGMKDYTAAFAYANSIGQPVSSPIYFAVDFDAGQVEFTNHIVPYFKGIYHGSHPVGVYGSGLVCRRLKELGLVSFTWLAQSKGWAESREKRDYNIVQHMPTKFYGYDIDTNDSNGNGGGFLVK